MTRTLPATLLAAGLAVAVPAGAIAAMGHHHALMKRRSAHHASHGTGVVTGGKSTATGGTPGGMPDRQ